MLDLPSRRTALGSGYALLELAPVVVTVRNAHGVLDNSTYILHNPFLGADSIPILQLMLGEIDFGDYPSFLNLADSLFNLGFGSGHSPRFGALERLPRLFYRGRQRGENGKSAGVVRKMIARLAITRNGRTLQTQKGRTGDTSKFCPCCSIYSLWAIAMNQNTPPKCVLRR